MSQTEIYSVGHNHCELIGEVSNAFRGAMYVWSQIAKKYFSLEYFPTFDEGLQSRIWNAQNEHPLTEAEVTVLTSTMDNVVVKSSDVPRLVKAFEEYAQDNPHSSLGEQAELIKSAELEDNQYVAWCQTSVCDFAFSPEIKDDDTLTYNDLSNAWDLFDQIDDKDDTPHTP